MATSIGLQANEAPIFVIARLAIWTFPFVPDLAPIQRVVPDKRFMDFKLGFQYANFRVLFDQFLLHLTDFHFHFCKSIDQVSQFEFVFSLLNREI